MSGSSECSSDELAPDSKSWVSRRTTDQIHGALRAWFLAVSFLCFALSGASAFSQQALTAEKTPVIGWRGTYLVGSWTDVVINFQAEEAGAYEVRITAPDPDGHRVTYSSSTHLLKGTHPLRGFFKAGQVDPELQITVVAVESGNVVWSWKSPSRSNVPLEPGIRLILTVGSPPGFDGNEAKVAGGLRTVAITVDELPTHPRAYDSVSLLVISARSILSVQQADAVRDWVNRGGRVLVSLPADVKLAGEIVQPFTSWLPVTVSAEPVTVSEFGKLENYSGKNVRIPFAGRMRIPGIKTTYGEVLAGSRDEALLVRTPYGLGSVTVLALDITQPPLSKWTELPALCRRLAEIAPEGVMTVGGPSRNMQLSSTGITDLATQLHAVQEDFPDINRASPWLIMGLLIVFLLTIGPLDYFIVHRLLKSPRGTWITLPIWVILATLLSVNLGTRWNGTTFKINQLNLVNVDVGSSTCHQRLWTNVYSPATNRHSISVDSVIATKPAKGTESKQSGWSGVAETAFGGMLRPANVHVGNSDYRLSSDASINDLPLMQWSSKPLLTEIHSADKGLVDCDLQSNGVGQLSGTVIHRFPGPIEDWLLAYGNRVYRHKKSRDDVQSLPFSPGQILRVDQPNVFPRELRGFLTGKVATGTKQTGVQSTDVAFTSYNPMSRDPNTILRILTFHNDIGGSKYTGLTNKLLETEDLSHLLKLGRAILLGRLKSPIATVRLDGQEIPADRETTFVKFVLPVTKVGGDVKPHLEKLEQ